MHLWLSWLCRLILIDQYRTLNESFLYTLEYELTSRIIFTGEVPDGLLVNSDREHLIYPVGNTIVVEEIKEDNGGRKAAPRKGKGGGKCTPEDPTLPQELLSGHNGAVSCLAVSKSGKYLASGEKTHMGFKAVIIIWDFERRSILHNIATVHKVKVEALAFSPNDKYLVSLGGQDDGK